MEDNERGQEVKQAADDMYYWCACVAGKPLPLLFSSLLSSLLSLLSTYLYHSALPSICAFRLALPSYENTHASLPVSDTFRQERESQPSSPSLDISRENAHACTLNKILPSSPEEETQRSIFLEMHINFFCIFIILFDLCKKIFRKNNVFH